MKNLKIGIVGAGNIAKCHIKSYKKLSNVEVVAISDINHERAKIISSEYGIPEVYNDYNEMFNKGKLDAISICTWTSLHKPCTISALKSGLNVLCEKPLAINASEAEEMKETADKKGKLLMVAYSRRFTENAILMHQLISQGKLGRIYYVKTGVMRRYGFPGGWFTDSKRSGGGPLIDSGVHIIDLVYYLMGKPKVKSVYSSIYFDTIGKKINVKGGVDWWKSSDYNIKNNCDVEDGAIAIIKFDNDSTVFVETSWVQNIKEDKLIYLEMYGTKAGATVEPDVNIYGDLNGYLLDSKLKINPAKNEFQNNIDREIKHFTDCIINSTECICPAEDGVETMKIIDAIYLSAKNNQVVGFS